MIATLNDLTVGDQGRIAKLDISDRAYKQQLMAMGLTRGAEFTVMRIAPLGDPIEIKIRGSALSLRKSDTFGVQIETKDR
nr:FeoA family protein [uncultured Cohaesibacter sp.]